MMTEKRRVYTAECKREAVRLDVHFVNPAPVHFGVNNV